MTAGENRRRLHAARTVRRDTDRDSWARLIRNSAELLFAAKVGPGRVKPLPPLGQQGEADAEPPGAALEEAN